MPRTFTKSTIMDMVNKTVRLAKDNPEQGPAFFMVLKHSVGLAITDKQFSDLVRTQGATEPDAGLYRVTLWKVTEDSYDGWR